MSVSCIFSLLTVQKHYKHNIFNPFRTNPPVMFCVFRILVPFVDTSGINCNINWSSGCYSSFGSWWEHWDEVYEHLFRVTFFIHIPMFIYMYVHFVCLFVPLTQSVNWDVQCFGDIFTYFLRVRSECGLFQGQVHMKQDGLKMARETKNGKRNKTTSNI